MKSFKELIVWKKAMDATNDIYWITRKFPKDEEFVLIVQLRRAAISVPSNIAEGAGRYSTKEYLRFLKIARGSVFEIFTQLEIAFRNNYIDENIFISINHLYHEISKMLSSIIKKLSNTSLNPKS